MLLSICIPTYNGEGRIKDTLDSVITAVKERPDIEIIVSDNCSIDDTYDILRKYADEGKITLHRNIENIGFKRNLFNLIEIYAKGKYCWTIGDDDMLSSDSIDIIYPLLQTYDIDYLSVNYKQTMVSGINETQCRELRTCNITRTHFYECQDANSSLGNVFGTYMASHIFLLDRVKGLNNEHLKNNDFNTFETVFPNAFLMRKAFRDSDKCYYINEALITAIYHEKTYSNRWENVVENIFPKYLNECEQDTPDIHYIKNNRLLVYNMNLRINIRRFLNLEFGNIRYKYIFSITSLLSLLKK